MKHHEHHDLDRHYGYVTLLLPTTLHEWFLQALEDSRIKAETGYEDYISQLFIEALRHRDPGIKTPGRLLYEGERFDTET